MSQVVEQKTKKRKHASADIGVTEPSSKRSKTGKTKKDKESSSRTKEGKKKDKGKTSADSQFTLVKATLALSIPPVFAMKPREGAEEMLDSMVMRYVPALQGVMLAHDSLQFTTSTATIKGECPFVNCTISFDATVWSPHVGMNLVGSVNLCSPDHVALLVHRTFNVSIPRHHIPTDNWEFEYGPLKNDPEIVTGSTENETGEAEETEGSGRWIHKVTGEKLGGEDGRLEFTVIGLTIANQMLSLIGSIQQDPFAPEHIPDHSITTVTPSKRRTASFPPPAIEDVEMTIEDVGSDEELDTFQTLGRMNDAETAEREAKRRKEEDERKQKEEKRRKRKADKAAVHAQEDDGHSERKKKSKKKDVSS